MAYARKKPLPARPITQVHSEETRQRIRAIKLIDRLQSFALSSEQDGQYRDEDGNAIRPMTPLQARISLALLDKVLPDLQTVEVSRTETPTYVIRAPYPVKDAVEWLNNFGPQTIDASPSGPHDPSPDR